MISRRLFGKLIGLGAAWGLVRGERVASEGLLPSPGELTRSSSAIGPHPGSTDNRVPFDTLTFETTQEAVFRATGGPIRLENRGLAIEIDPHSGGILRLRNRLTEESYQTKAIPFRLETDRGTVSGTQTASVHKLQDGLQFTYNFRQVRVQMRYRVRPEDVFFRKSLEIQNIGRSALSLREVVTDQWDFSPSFLDIHPHYDPSQLHWLINLFLRGSKGGFYCGIANPLYAYWSRGDTPPKSTLQLDYCPDLFLLPGESYTTDASFLGAYRKERIYLFKELGKLSEAMSAPKAIATALNFDQEILDWGEVWGMQSFMSTLGPAHELEQPGYYVRVVAPVGGLRPGSGSYLPFKRESVEGCKEFVDLVAELGHIPHIEWATEWFGVGGYAKPTPGYILEDAGPGDRVPVNPNWLEVVKYGWQKGLKVGIFETVIRNFARKRLDWKVKKADGSLWTWSTPRQPVNCWANREYVEWRLSVIDQAIRDYKLYMVAWDSAVPAEWAWLGWPEIETKCFATNHGHRPGDIRYGIYRNIIWFLGELQQRHPRLALRVASGMTTDYPWALKNLIEYHPDFYDGETGAAYWTSWNFRFLPMYKSGLLLSAKTKEEFEWLLLRSISESDHFMLWGDTVSVALQNKTFWIKWLTWADRNIDFVRRGRTIFREPWGDKILASLPPNLEGRLPAPRAALHGTAHCITDSGYLFIFNPSPGPRIGQIPINHWIGLSEGTKFVAKVIYPDGGDSYGPYRRGEDLKVEVPPHMAVILHLLPAAEENVKGKPVIPAGVPVDKAFLSWEEIPWTEITPMI